MVQSYQQMFTLFGATVVKNSFENAELRAILETYTFEMFTDQLKSWLVNGRYQWFICGNFTKERAITLVKTTKEKFALKGVKISDLPKINMIKIEMGKSYQLDLPLKDDKNENACVLSYYQVGCVKKNIKLAMIYDVIMQFVNEPFFDDLRTKQQLGYVVFSRAWA